MRVLFLDFDGVLNSRLWFEQNREAITSCPDMFERSLEQLDPTAVRLVSDLVERFNLTVIISSTWRRLHSLDEINEMLRARGWNATPAIGVTPALRDSFFRGDEINAWLNEHPEVITHVILDDDSDFHADQNLVQTSMLTGVTHEHIDLAIGFLV